MSERTVVLLGELSPSDGPVAQAVAAAGFPAAGVAKWSEWRSRFSGDEVLAVLFPAGMKGWEELCVETRTEPGYEEVPLIAVVETPWSEALGRLFMFSIDDYVALGDLRLLAPKLVALSAGDPYGVMQRFSGRVVVADPDRSRRVLYGRLLRRRGFDVDFAINGPEVGKLALKDDKLALVLTSVDLPPTGARAAWESFRAHGGRLSSVPWLVGGPKERPTLVGDVPGAGGPLRPFDEKDPPENLLFHINELLSPPPANVRSSPRLLFGAPATFRLPGTGEVVPAFTYNINLTGVFLRTLAPPPQATEVAVELRPPFGEGRAAVAGKVVWRKEVAAKAGPVVPAGMGIVWTRVPVADGAALQAGYEALLAATPGAGRPEEGGR